MKEERKAFPSAVFFLFLLCTGNDTNRGEEENKSEWLKENEGGRGSFNETPGIAS